MDTISVITINGDMFFVENSYPKDAQKDLEEIAKQVAASIEIPLDADDSRIFDLFLHEVQRRLGVVLHVIRVSNVLRIDR